MTKDGHANLTPFLALRAAALALTAALIEDSRDGTLNLALTGAALFLVALGFGAKNRMQGGDH